MRTSLLVFTLLALPLRADDAATKAALAAWNGLDIGVPAVHEADAVRVVGLKDTEAKLKAVAATVGRYRDKAIATLQLAPKDAHPGKITVYLLPSAGSFPSFARNVEMRRPEPGETGSFAAEDERLHVAATPAKGGGTPIDVRAGELAASLLLMRKAGVKTPVPDWLAHGFGRATTYRLSPKDRGVLADKKLIKAAVRRKGAADVWDGKLEADEAGPMNAALAEFFAYGPGAARFAKLLAAYKPTEEDAPPPTTGQALDAIGVSPATTDRLFRNWAVK
ncbi:MAG: hypothetical protein ACRC33_01905 [Gemmataceae bacterium]